MGITYVREWLYGEQATRNHQGVWYDAGSLAGDVATTLVGGGVKNAPKWIKRTVDTYQNVEKIVDRYQTVKTLTDGCIDLNDAIAIASSNKIRTKKLTQKNEIVEAIDPSPKSSFKKNTDNSLPNNSTKEPNCFNSFVAGTEVLTPDGEKNIEDIKVGDEVIADDPTTPGEIETKKVVETFKRTEEGIFDLYVDGEIISVTGTHDFWVESEGWVKASDLEIGDRLTTENGTVVDIDKIQHRDGKYDVYNFEVEDFHTYFVSDLGVLVHNVDCSPNSDSLTKLERVKIFLDRLDKASPASSVDEALDLINKNIDEVEDAFSGVPKNPDAINLPNTDDGRMYGVLDKKFVKTLDDGRTEARTRKNVILIELNGSFQIFIRDRTAPGQLGKMIFQKNGG